MITFTASIRYVGAGQPHQVLAEIADDLCGEPWIVKMDDLGQRSEECTEAAVIRHVRSVFAQAIDDAGYVADTKPWTIGVEIDQ